MTERYLSKFKFADKFDHLPEQMELNARGNLCLAHTKIDMIPAGLKGVYIVFMAKKPRYIAPDFKGDIMYEEAHRINYMDNLEVQAAKARYNLYRDMVEKPRYIEEKDGSLSLCSLPTDMHIFYDFFKGGYCLDLTQTSIREKQNLGGFKEVILEPKKVVQQEFPFVLAQKVASHKSGYKTPQKLRAKE